MAKRKKVGYAVGPNKMKAEGAARAIKGKDESKISGKADKVREAVDATSHWRF